MPKDAPSTEQILSAQNLLLAVCNAYEINLGALCGTEFREPLITARNVAMYLLVHQEKLSREVSGRLLHRGRRAASYAFYRIGVLRELDAQLQERIQQIQAFFPDMGSV
jgi:chromosomal replication initiation ATPase DnaA